jgi:hypothetical protein
MRHEPIQPHYLTSPGFTGRLSAQWTLGILISSFVNVSALPLNVFLLRLTQKNSTRLKNVAEGAQLLRREARTSWFRSAVAAPPRR